MTRLSWSDGHVSAGARPSTHRPRRRRRRRGRRAAAAARPDADRQRPTSTTASVSSLVSGSLLKEEPVQFPVTIHTSAAYLVTKINLYSTFSIYFRVRNSQFTRPTRRHSTVELNRIGRCELAITQRLCVGKVYGWQQLMPKLCKTINYKSLGLELE